MMKKIKKAINNARIAWLKEDLTYYEEMLEECRISNYNGELKEFYCDKYNKIKNKIRKLGGI